MRTDQRDRVLMGPGAHSMMHGMTGGGLTGLALAAVILGVLVVLGIAILITIRSSSVPNRPAHATGRLLASDRARDRTIRVLAGAYTTGHLTSQELEDRTRLALSARTRGDLGLLTQDISPDPEDA